MPSSVKEGRVTKPRPTGKRSSQRNSVKDKVESGDIQGETGESFGSVFFSDGIQSATGRSFVGEVGVEPACPSAF